MALAGNDTGHYQSTVKPMNLPKNCDMKVEIFTDCWLEYNTTVVAMQQYNI